MITKYKDSVRLAYDELYEEIAKASKAELNKELNITSLESFFGNISTIKKLSNGKFLRLPLDEPLFEIDANSRKITIPTDFASNGLSVQGDHLAETIFFSIDRYFDYMDLSNCKIRINWKMGNTVGQSVNFVESTDIEPGKIIFGWPVAKDLTGRSGSLSFAVEFYQEDGSGEIKYSLNTLIASVNIKEGLVLIDPEVIDVSSDILNMLQNSSFGEGDAKVELLKWLTGNTDGNGGLVLDINDAKAIEVLNLMSNTDALNGLASVPAKLYALAQAGNALIKYDAPDGITVFEEYVLVAKLDDDGKRIPLDTTRNYYVEDPDVSGAYKPAKASDITTWNDEVNYAQPNTSKIYEKYASIEVKGTGKYSINGQGYILDTEGHVIGQGAVTSTPTVIVPSPELPNEIIVTVDNGALDEGYAIDEDLVDKVAFLDAEGKATLKVSAKYDNPAYAEGKALVLYNWYKDDVQQDATNATWVRPHDEQELEAVEEGKYKVGIKTYLNGETTPDEAFSEEYLVSPLASRITERSIGFEGLDLKGGLYWIDLTAYTSGESNRNAQKEFTIKYSLDGDYSDDVVCTLFYVADGETTKVDTLKTTKVDGGVKVVVTSKVIDNNEGNYLIQLTNKYSGSAFSRNSEAFYINIQ